MRRVKMDFSSVAIEKELRAKLGLVYLDFVNDYNPDFAIKNQLFADSMDQFKDSELPYYQKLDQYVVENKFTIQKRFSHVPDWMTLNTISSVNVRNSRTGGMSGGGDYDDRVDVSLPGNPRTPYDTFVSPRENSTYELGLPFTNDGDTVFTESGGGVMLDVTIKNRFILLGTRARRPRLRRGAGGVLPRRLRSRLCEARCRGGRSVLRLAPERCGAVGARGVGGEVGHGCLRWSPSRHWREACVAVPAGPAARQLYASHRCLSAPEARRLAGAPPLG
jgi:hypothetical protein